MTRAVLRFVQPGSLADCAECGRPVNFSAKDKPKQVIANVYRDGRWLKVEHFHPQCYADAGNPWGEPDESQLNPALFG